MDEFMASHNAENESLKNENEPVKNESAENESTENESAENTATASTSEDSRQTETNAADDHTDETNAAVGCSNEDAGANNSDNENTGMNCCNENEAGAPANDVSPEALQAETEKLPVTPDPGSETENTGPGLKDSGTGAAPADCRHALRDAPFYTENYRKRPQKKDRSLWQLALVSVVSAFIGAFAFAAMLVFLPKTSPAVREYLQEIAGNYIDSSAVRALSVDKKLEVIGESNLVAEIAEAVGPTVVGVKVTYKNTGNFLFRSRQEEGVASGVIIRKDGYIMTNFHVIQNALDLTTNKVKKDSKIEIILPNKPNKPYVAEYIGGDYKTDLAVLKINATNLPVAKMGDSDKIRVGELAVAIGNPGGLELAGSVTSGVISGVNRKLPLDDGTELQLIQTDAAISPGNSGGALVNSKGEIIGVNRLKIVGYDMEGLGFAIPINKAREITDSLIEVGYVKGRPWLGITAHPQYTEEIAEMYGTPYGVYVREVHIMSGAEKAGIQVGDIITKFDGKRVYTVDDINAIKDTKKPGDVVTVEIYRDGEYKTLKVTLTEAKY